MPTKYPYDFKKLSKKHNVQEKTIRARLDSGKTLEEALRQVDYRSGNGKKQCFRYEWNGLFGLDTIARSLGFSRNTLLRYVMLAGGDLDKGISDAIASKNRVKVAHRDVSSTIGEKKAFQKPEYSKAMAIALGI